MASIQSLGVGSGLLTSELVDDIISAEREATDLRLEAKRAEIDARISSFASIQSAVQTLRSSTTQLATSQGLLANLATSSEESAVTATASASATPGVHTVEVTSLARKQTLASIRFDSVEDVVGDGTLNIRFGTTTLDQDGNYDSFTENTERASVSIAIDPNANTLGGVRDAINEANVGINANIVNDGDGFVLVLTSDQAGADNSLEITVTEGATAGLAALNYNASASTPGTHLSQTVAAQDALLTVDGISIRREDNVISEVVPGVTFNALAVTSGEVTVSVAQDNEEIVSRVEGFVDAFNDLKSLVDELTAFDEDEGTGSLLTGDSTIRGLRTQMRRLLTSSISQLSGGDFRALVDVGITTDQNSGFALKLDASVLTNALAQDPESVATLLSTSTVASDDLITVTSFQNGTEAGDYDVFISQVATQGYLDTQAVVGLGGGVTIDADNDDLTLVVDGVGATVQLTAGVYADGDALAQEIQNQINVASSLAAAGVSVNVAFDATNEQLRITSQSYGSNSQVEIVTADTNSAAQLGLVTDDGSLNKGVDVAGTINGIAGNGSGQFLSIPVGPVPATSGVYRASPIAGFDTPPLTIDADNNNFVVSVDGTTSSTITLSNGDYTTPANLASEIETQINADPTLAAASATVSVSFNSATQAFEITSDSVGLNSRVDITAAAVNVPSELGLAVASGTAGKSASTQPDIAGGLQIQVLGGSVGERGTASLVRGVMSQFDRFLSDTLSFDGSIRNKLTSLEARLADINEESQEFSDRMDLLEDRLRTQFAAADALISQLNSTGQFLDSQLANLPGFTRNDS